MTITSEQRARAIELAISRGGGIIATAAALKVTHQAISSYRKNRHVPFCKATQMEVLWGVPRELLLAPHIAEAYLTPRNVVDDIL